jgi:hypothetical protein
MGEPINLPEVRQCQDPESDQFGHIAVKSDNERLNWCVMNPNQGGYVGMPDDWVEDWAIMQATGSLK